MRIGVYGSSFDPITFGHLWSANTIAAREGLDKVIFLPSSNKRIDKIMHTLDEHRLKMLYLAVEGNDKFEVDDWEMRARDGNYHTCFTLEHFKRKYPDDEIFFLLGADLLANLPSWTHGVELIKNNKFIVIERENIIMHKVIAQNPALRKYERNFTLVYKGLLNEISSSFIRDEFRFDGDPRYLLPDAVYQYIIDNNLYRGE